jgi:15-cis-phytoene synthase
MIKPGVRDIDNLNTLYAQAAEITRAGSRTFALATRFCPLDLARSAHAVYWFCFYTRELARQAATLEQARADLDQWCALVTAGLRGRLAHHPVLDVFLDTLDHRGIPHDYVIDFVEGVRAGLDQTRCETFAQLRSQCYRLGSTVSMMLTHVVGFRDPALDYIGDLGIAIELTSLLRDTGEHLSQDRIYLPLDEIESFGYSEAELRQHTRNDAFRRLMRFQIARTQEYFQKSEPGLALLNSRGRFAVKVAFDLYRKTLRRIETSDFDVFSRRPGVPAVERAWITARSMAGPVTRRLWRVMGA